MTLRMLLATQPVLPLAQSARFFAQLCRETERRLAQAEPLWLHPSAVHVGPDGRPAIGGQDIPSDPRDVACLAPESVATRTPADARSAVYAIGAMFYESVTGTPVGPQMKRPAELGMPALADTLLARALAPDAQKRPADLGALASAFDQLAATAPTAVAAAAPAASTSLPPDGYDVAFSMAPPPGMEVAPPSAPQSAPQSSRNPVPAAATSSRSLDPFGNVIVAAPPPSARAVKPTATQELTELKARLEADPTPRYVVSKDKMDHGPFNAVELLQQIASHTFEGHHGLRDEVTGQDRTIDEWPEFARFAEHARIHREVVAEKKAVVQLEKDEKKAGIAKYLIGSAVALGLVAASVIVIVKVRGTHREGADIVDDPSAMDLNVDGGLKGRKTAGGAGGKGGAGGGGGGGGYARGGQSYESALASNNQEVNIGGGGGGPDLTDNQLAAPMRNATFIGGCGAPNDMKVTVRVAIKMGRAVGVSVYTNPADGAVASCVDRHVRGLAWPANGKMDSFTTTY